MYNEELGNDELPEIEIVMFDRSDVIRTSPGLGEEDDLFGPPAPGRGEEDDFFVNSQTASQGHNRGCCHATAPILK